MAFKNPKFVTKPKLTLEDTRVIGKKLTTHITGMIVPAILSVLIAAFWFYMDQKIMGIAFVIYGVIDVFNMWFQKRSVRKTFKNFLDAGDLDREYQFFDDHLILKTAKSATEIPYDDFEGMIETDDMIYLLKKLGLGAYLKKSELKDYQLDFVRNILSKEKIKEGKKSRKRKVIIASCVPTLFIIIAFLIILKSVPAKQKYTQYESTEYVSFHRSVERDSVNKVTIDGDYIVYVYEGKPEVKTYVTKLAEDKEELLDFLKENNVEVTEK